MVSRAVLLFLFLESLPLFARLDGTLCGTHPERPAQEMFLHRQSARLKRTSARLSTPALARPDSGDIAIVEDADGVVARRNPFNLNQKTLQFSPSNKEATRYKFTVGDQTYDDAAAANGQQLIGLGDDDTRLVPFPFAFPFFGAAYREVYVNSDGNLTFGAGDPSSSDRSLGRLTAGPPRIAPLLDDLDPSRNIGSVRVLAEPSRVVVSWVEVPEYSDFGSGFRQTFQARLYPDGRIEIVFFSVLLQSAVVGIAPGNLTGESRLVTFLLGGLDEEFSGAIAERFTNSEQVDIVTAAQKFYETHEDSYDYLAIFNALGLPADSGVVAYEVTLRNRVTGNGDRPAEGGKEYGSPARLQSVLNMGPLTQYPPDPSAFVIARFQQRDTPITAIATKPATASWHSPASATRRTRRPGLCSAIRARTGTSSSIRRLLCSKATVSATMAPDRRRALRPSPSPRPTRRSTSI